MQASNQIKHFTCQLHPSEVIERVCLDNNVGSSLVCTECILNNEISKDDLLNLDEFLENAIKQEQTFQRISAFKNTPPKELIDVLAQEDENIAKFSQHVEQEKQRVNNALDTMIQEFTQLCLQKKNEIAFQLDKQLVTLKFNYAYYKSNLEKFSHKENEINPDKKTLVSRINQCKDTNQAEVLVKNIKDDLLEASNPDDLEQKIHQIKENFSNLAQILQDQARSLPKTKFCNQTAIDISLSEFRKATNKLMEDFVEIEKQISELSFTNVLSIDSKLIKNQEDLALIKQWLAPSHKDFQLRLLYRGTRDGMDCENFHKKCDNHPTTLVVAKSNHGKVFGGYADKSWNSYDDYKVSQNSWLFSIDEKLKFPIMESGFPYAIYTASHHGPIFGAGHDLYIALPEEYEGESYYADSKSSSDLGSSYQKNSPSNKTTILAGSHEFDIVELEIYSVEKFGLYPKNSKLDSEIINPTQDLYLIESWLGRGKNHKLELIYRGNNRDGTSAVDFHLYCDNKGPTLVICKSARFDQVFGGFTSKNWSQDNVYVEDQEAFLFSLTHGTKHPIIDKDHAIFCSGEYGPVFGAGRDLLICSENNITGDSSSTLGVSYQVSESIENVKSYLAGEEHFLVEEIEVFVVKTSEN